jgi:hypothetical protein
VFCQPIDAGAQRIESKTLSDVLESLTGHSRKSPVQPRFQAWEGIMEPIGEEKLQEIALLGDRTAVWASAGQGCALPALFAGSPESTRRFWEFLHRRNPQRQYPQSLLLRSQPLRGLV